MYIARYRDSTGERWGVVNMDTGTICALRGDFQNWAPLITHESRLAPLTDSVTDLSTVTLLAPITSASRVYGTGMNFRSHTEMSTTPERAQAAPVFMLPLSAMIGPGEEIRYPDITNQLDYEIEIVAIIGAPVNEPSRALRSVLGYTIGCDTSARDVGMPVGLPVDFFSMKGLDSTRPLGPWIVTRDEFGSDSQPAARMTTRVNGEVRQNDTTAAMVWSVERCVSWVNARNALQPGDLIFTGTCGGTAVESEIREPGTGHFLEPGDEIEFEIEGIGILRSRVGPKSPNHVGFPTSITDGLARSR